MFILVLNIGTVAGMTCSVHEKSSLSRLCLKFSIPSLRRLSETANFKILNHTIIINVTINNNN